MHNCLKFILCVSIANLFLLLTSNSFAYKYPLKSLKQNDINLVELDKIAIEDLLNNTKTFRHENPLIIDLEFINKEFLSGDTYNYNGRLLIASIDGLHYKRIIVNNKLTDDWVEYIICEGKEIKVWKRTSRVLKFESLEHLLLGEYFQDSILFTPYDLIMSYMNDSDYFYEGPKLFKVRSSVQSFWFYPKDKLHHGLNEFNLINILIDDEFKGVRKINYFHDDELINSIEVLGIKMVNKIWIPSLIESKSVNQKTLIKIIEVKGMQSIKLKNFFQPNGENIESILDL